MEQHGPYTKNGPYTAKFPYWINILWILYKKYKFSLNF